MPVALVGTLGILHSGNPTLQVCPARGILVDGPTAEPPPKAADHLSFVAFLDDKNCAGRTVASAHFMELVGVRVIENRRYVVHGSTS